MVQVVTTLSDLSRTSDLDGMTTIEEHTLMLDGEGGRLHLTAEESEELAGLLRRYLDVCRKDEPETASPAAPPVASRRTPKLTRPAEPVKTPKAANGHGNGKVDRAALIAWGQSRGIAVNARGRIKQEVLEQFQAEHSNGNGAAPAEVAAKAPRARVTKKTTKKADAGPRSKPRPTDQELLDLARQVGTGGELAAELGVAPQTAKRWHADALLRQSVTIT